MQKVKHLQGFLGFLPYRKQESVLQFAAPQEFGINFGQFGQLTLKFQMYGDTGTGAFALFGSFEQELAHPASSQALVQIIKRAVLESSPATAVWLAARQVLADKGGSQ